MKKTFLLFISMVVICTSTIMSDDLSPISFGSKWQLSGFFNAETNQLIRLDSIADNWYTLEFSSDSVVVYEDVEYRVCRGQLSKSSSWGFYTVDYANSLVNFEVIIRSTTVADSEDGEKFDRALYLSHSFELDNGTLKMFYGDKGDYLLFGAETLSNADTPNAINLSKSASSKVTSSGKNLTVTPNPILRSVGIVNFYRDGNVSRTALKIYDANGKFVRKVHIYGNNMGKDGVHQKVGSWDLKDSKGRTVAVGTYLVKGTAKALGGKKENISLLIGVR